MRSHTRGNTQPSRTGNPSVAELRQHTASRLLRALPAPGLEAQDERCSPAAKRKGELKKAGSATPLPRPPEPREPRFLGDVIGALVARSSGTDSRSGAPRRHGRTDARHRRRYGHGQLVSAGDPRSGSRLGRVSPSHPARRGVGGSRVRGPPRCQDGAPQIPAPSAPSPQLTAPTAPRPNPVRHRPRPPPSG